MTRVVDSQVTRCKSEREVNHLRSIEATLVARGWWLMRAEFPIVKVAFRDAGSSFENDPVRAQGRLQAPRRASPAITFENPFNARKLQACEMVTHLPRRLSQPSSPPGDQPLPALEQRVNLYQHYLNKPNLPGFLCLPGVCAYHDHPAHAGDPWEIHRTCGSRRLFDPIEIVWQHGTAPIDRLSVRFSLSLTMVPN